MKQDGRNGRRRGRRNYPLDLGLAVSALAHLLLVLLNPGMAPTAYGPAGATSAEPGAQFTVLSLSARDEEDRLRLETPPRTTDPRSTPLNTRGPASSEAGAAGRGTDAERDIGA